MSLDFDYAAARKAGYSDDDILSGLQKRGELDFDLSAARRAGYSSSDIMKSLVGTPKPEEEQSGFRRLGDVGLSVAKGVIGVPEAAVGLADIFTGGKAGKAAEWAGFRPREAREFLDEFMSKKQRAANKEVADAEGFVGTAGAMLRNPSTIGHTAVEALPSMAAGGLIGRGVAATGKIAPYVAGAIGEGVVGAGSAAEHARQQTEDGELTIGQSGAALGSGVTTALFGAVGGRIAQKLGVSDIDTVLASGPSAITNKGVVRRMIEGGVSEGVFEELPQSIQEQVWQNAALDRPLMEGVPESAAQGMLTGTALGGVAGGALSGRPQDVTPDVPASDPLLIENKPDPFISFPDGTVGRQAEVDAYIVGLPEDQQLSTRARLLGIGEPVAKPEIADIYQAETVDDAIMAAAAVVDAPTEIDIELKNRQIDQAFAAHIAGLRQQEFDLAEQARRDADFQAAESQVRDQAVERANLITEAQGFDTQEPTAMQLAMQEAQARRAQFLTPVSQRAEIAPPAPAVQAADTIPQAQEVPNVESPATAASVRNDGNGSLGSIAQAQPSQAQGLAPLQSPAEIGRDSIAAKAPSSSRTGVSGANSAMGSPAALSAVSGDKIDSKWTAFAPDSGTLNIDRAAMPQVKAAHRGAMVNYLNARGVTHEQAEVAADSLKPTQREFSPEKIQKALDHEGGDRSILVSSDGHVLDGHHQWLAKMQSGEPVKVIRLNAPIRELLDHVKEFPSSQVAAGASGLDRRADVASRRKLAEMSPEEMRRALATSDLTGIPNKRAFEDHVHDNPQDNVLYGDLDDFKAMNTKYGHDGADQILRGVGAIKAAVAKRLGVAPYHRSGDEFLATHRDGAKLEEYGKEIQEVLAKSEFHITAPDGTVVVRKGVGFSYGTAQNTSAAEARSDEQKVERKRLGLRAGDRRAVSSPEQGRQADQNSAAGRDGTPDQVAQAKAVLNAAQVTGKDRLDLLDRVKTGSLSLEDLAEAYPATKTELKADTSEDAKMPTGITSKSVSSPEGRKNNGDPLDAEARWVEGGITGKTATEAADWIAQTSPFEAHRLIAEKIATRLREMESAGSKFVMHIVNVGDRIPSSLVGARGQVSHEFDSDETHIWLNGADVRGYVGTSYETTLHELLHATTQMAIFLGNRRTAEGSGLAKSVSDLYNIHSAIVSHFNNRVRTVGKNGLTDFEKQVYESRNNALQNPDEVVAWAMTSRNMQSYLEGIEYGERSMWSAFVDAVRSFLGLTAGANTALSEVMRLTEDILNAPINDLLVQAKTNKISMAINNPGGLTNQNKSTTVNSTKRTGWNAPDIKWQDNVIRTMQDKMVDTKKVVAAIRENIGAIADKWNPYLQEELFHGRSAKRVTDFQESELRPLVQEMQIRKVDIPEFEEYLHNRHAEERNNQIAKVNDAMPDGGSGIDTADARKYLNGLPQAKKKHYEALAKRIDAINKKTRQELVDAGMETPETIAAWEGAYQYYVPLQREESGAGIGQGFSVRGSSSKRATGSKREVVNVLANLMMQRERAIVRIEKNRVATALMGLAIENPNPDFWKVDDAPTERVVETRGGKDQVVEREVFGFRSRDNVLSVRLDGKDHFVIFNDDNERAMGMVKALKNLDADQLGRVLSMSAKVTRYFAAINTQYNPIFGGINLIRDTQGALLNLSTTQIAGKQKAVLAHTASALRGIYIDLRDHRAGKSPSSTWATLYEEFQNEGGQTGYRDMFATSKDRTDALKNELNPDAWMDSRFGKLFTANGTLKVPLSAASKSAAGVFNWLSDYNTAMENAVRLAAYKVGKEQGMSNQQAASMAKNLTVNFNRKGQVATQAGALYAFFNASVQGTTRLAETLRGPMGKKIVAGGLLLGSMQAMLLAAAGFGEDEPPEHLRSRNIIIPTGDGKYISIPMPLGFNLIPSISRLTTEFALEGFKNPTKKLATMIDLFADTFNPIGNAGLSLQTIAPTAIDPLAALSENRDWTGKNIAKEDMNSLAPTPGHMRAKDTASEIGKVLSYWLNLASGGTKYTPGMVSPTSDQLDYLIGQATGGVGREALKAEQTVTSTVTGEDLPPHKVPILGRFYGDTKGNSGVSAKFYDNLKDLNAHESEIKGRRADGGDVISYVRENPEATLVQLANRVERDVQALRKRKRELLERDAGKEVIQQIEAQISNKMKLLNGRVSALREKQAA